MMNKKLLAIMTAAAVIFLAGQPIRSEQARPRCAFVSEVSGKAVLQRGGKYYLLRGMDGIYCGERVKVMAGAKVVVADCGTNMKSEISGPAEFSVEQGKLVFKKGKAENSVKVDAELCPFFLGQAFDGPELAQVDADGSNPEKYATFVVKSFEPNPRPAVFHGAISEIRGDVYFSAPRIIKIAGDVVPEDGSQIYSRADGGLAIYSCAENKKYVFEGSALIQIAADKPNTAPVTFVGGRAARVEDLDPAKCEAVYKTAVAAGQANLKLVGLDGK